MIDKSSIPSRLSSVVSKTIKGECLLVPLSSHIADMDSLYRLNETGAFIWNAIDGQKSVSELARLVANEFEVDPEVAMRDTVEFINAIEKFVQLNVS
ncbi:MAG TPA: PqqD family protein [Bacteroidales bacterium]|nr:PqqD family protein [Bacteroidales bacterium]